LQQNCTLCGCCECCWWGCSCCGGGLGVMLPWPPTPRCTLFADKTSCICDSLMLLPTSLPCSCSSFCCTAGVFLSLSQWSCLPCFSYLYSWRLLQWNCLPFVSHLSLYLHWRSLPCSFQFFAILPEQFSPFSDGLSTFLSHLSLHQLKASQVASLSPLFPSSKKRWEAIKRSKNIHGPLIISLVMRRIPSCTVVLIFFLKDFFSLSLLANHALICSSHFHFCD
jgi:hypothetical protein